MKMDVLGFRGRDGATATTAHPDPNAPVLAAAAPPLGNGSKTKNERPRDPEHTKTTAISVYIQLSHGGEPQRPKQLSSVSCRPHTPMRRAPAAALAALRSRLAGASVEGAQ